MPNGCFFTSALSQKTVVMYQPVDQKKLILSQISIVDNNCISMVDDMVYLYLSRTCSVKL